jgi:serine/threonine-protein kinase
VVGTPQYMAPEQMFDEPLDGRADQFAWGVVAYEVLTGRLPWRGTSWSAIIQLLSTPPDPIRAVNPEVPEGVAAVIERALAKPRDERFASMAEVIAALQPFAGAPRAMMASAGLDVFGEALTAEAPPLDSAPAQLAPIEAEAEVEVAARAPHRKRRLALVLPLVAAIAVIAAFAYRAATPVISAVPAATPSATAGTR